MLNIPCTLKNVIYHFCLFYPGLKFMIGCNLFLKKIELSHKRGTNLNIFVGNDIGRVYSI